jgi:hypothetical protein
VSHYTTFLIVCHFGDEMNIHDNININEYCFKARLEVKMNINDEININEHCFKRKMADPGYPGKPWV